MRSKKPLVSILCLTYNQQDYIRETLDSFLMQECDFDFEIFIHDDASTDDTPKIIKEYQRHHPGTIRTIWQKDNQFSQGKRNFFARFMLNDAKGKYIALCEGDDFWTDPKKLQIQVDFLESHTNYALCFHPVKVFFEGQEKEYRFPEDHDPKAFTVKRLLQANFIQTNSVMYRKQAYKNLAVDLSPGDWYLHLLHAQFGKIGFIDKVMAAYRRHPRGLWWNAANDIQEIWEKHGLNHLRLYLQMLEMYGKKSEYADIINSNIDEMLGNLISVDDKQKSSLVEEAMHNISGSGKIITRLYKTLQQKHAYLLANRAELEAKLQELGVLRNELRAMSEHANQIQTELELIKSSRVWRTRTKAYKLVGKKP